jgi:hypothetical protein
MRDVIDFTTETTFRKYLNGSLSYEGSTPVPLTRTQRADGVSTTPTDSGLFYRHTAYDAFFAYTSITPGECEFQTHRWPYLSVTPWDDRRHEWTGGYFPDASVIHHGCNGATLKPEASLRCQAILRSKMRSRLRNNSFNFGQTLGEMNETVRTMADLARNYVQLWKQLKNGRPLRPDWSAHTLRVGGFSKDLAKAYLTFQYGIKPIMNDLYNMAKVLREGLNSPNFASISVDALDPDFPGPWDTYPQQEEGYLWYSGTVQRGMTSGIHFRIDSPQAFDLWRYGITNPLSIAWELVPLSFVVDWFTGIGNFIDGLQKPVGLNFESGYETTWISNQISYNVGGTVGAPDVPIRITKDGTRTAEVRTFAMKRELLPWLVPAVPYSTIVISGSQATSLVALTKAMKF